MSWGKVVGGAVVAVLLLGTMSYQRRGGDAGAAARRACDLLYLDRQEMENGTVKPMTDVHQAVSASRAAARHQSKYERLAQAAERIRDAQAAGDNLARARASVDFFDECLQIES